MGRTKRIAQWHTPDTPGDMLLVKPPGELLVGRDQPVELRHFSVRRREAGVSLNFYSRKTNSGVPSYGITVTPEMARLIGESLVELGEQMTRQQGKRIEEV